jgi:hypothetical protein
VKTTSLLLLSKVAQRINWSMVSFEHWQLDGVEHASSHDFDDG